MSAKVGAYFNEYRPYDWVSRISSIYYLHKKLLSSHIQGGDSHLKALEQQYPEENLLTGTKMTGMVAGSKMVIDFTTHFYC